MASRGTYAYRVILNGWTDGRPYEHILGFKHHKAAYGAALDFVVHGPVTNRAIVRLNGKPFLRIEKDSGRKLTVTIDWTGESE